METMTPGEIMEFWRPGSHDEPWTWADEAADLAGELDDMINDIQVNGILHPVVLGVDGRVWDGHHRILAARALGVRVPVIDSDSDAPCCMVCFEDDHFSAECLLRPTATVGPGTGFTPSTAP